MGNDWIVPDFVQKQAIKSYYIRLASAGTPYEYGVILDEASDDDRLTVQAFISLCVYAYAR